MKRSLALLFWLALMGLVWWGLDLGQWLHLGAWQAVRERWADWHAAAPLQTTLGFVALYVLVTALSLPGATVLSLLGGALLGVAWGTLWISLAATLGATLAMLSARLLLRAPVQAWLGRRWPQQWQNLEAGLAREGAWFLLSLRLVPVVPFFLLNLAMGLTRMKTWTYAWVSGLGMLPGALVYVNAGAQLGRLGQLSDLARPSFWAAWVALALMPWVCRWLLSRWQSWRQLRPWAAQRPRRFDRNLVVIGGGAAGLVTAYMAAALKARVTLVEAGRLGGDCLHTGCVPSKALIEAARQAHQARQAHALGIESTVRVDFRAVMARVQRVIEAIEPHDSAERYTALGVDVRMGRARLLDPWTVEIERPDGSRERLTTRSVVLATGAAPVWPDVPGLQELAPLTSETLWPALARCEQAPGQLLILGGGAIGCELAQAMARLGSQVHLIEAGPRLLPREDEAVAQIALESLQADGVRVWLSSRAVSAQCDSGQRVLHIEQHGQTHRLPLDLLLCAVGRRPRWEGLGLEALGLTLPPPVSDRLNLPLPHIQVAGDLAGRAQYTHLAAHQAWHAALNALWGHWHRLRVDERFVPRTLFIDPEVATVGLNETEARARGVAYEMTRLPLSGLDRAIVDGRTEGFIQCLTVPGRDRLLGVTLVGAHAGDLLAECVLAMKQGLGLNALLASVRAYPSRSDILRQVAGEWKRAHAPQGLLRWVERYHAWRRG